MHFQQNFKIKIYLNLQSNSKKSVNNDLQVLYKYIHVCQNQLNILKRVT